MCPSITRHDVNNELRWRVKKDIIYFNIVIIQSDEGNVLPAPVETVDIVAIQLDEKKGGRPTGATQNKRKVSEMTLAKVEHEIVTIFEKERKIARKMRMKRGRLDEVISEAEKHHGVSDDVVIKKDLIRQRIKQTVVVSTGQSGLTSPLRSIKPQITAVLI